MDQPGLGLVEEDNFSSDFPGNQLCYSASVIDFIHDIPSSSACQSSISDIWMPPICEYDNIFSQTVVTPIFMDDSALQAQQSMPLNLRLNLDGCRAAPHENIEVIEGQQNQSKEIGDSPRPINKVSYDEIESSPGKPQTHSEVHKHICFECKAGFRTLRRVQYHAFVRGHEAFRCDNCDARFSREDVLKRHALQHSAIPAKYSCTHCRKWRSPNGFARKDHLTQHLRNYHHIEVREADCRTPATSRDGNPRSLGFYMCCLHEDCPMFRYSSNDWHDPIFASRSAYTAHMRQEHDESTFSCTKPGCKRVRGKGFFRKRDLVKHLKREHDVDADAKIKEAEEMSGLW